MKPARDTVRPRLRVLVASVGSRGDVEPFILLSEALARRGHQIVVTLDSSYRDALQRTAGVTFRALGSLDARALERIVRRAIRASSPAARSLAAYDSFVEARRNRLFRRISSLVASAPFDVVIVCPALLQTRQGTIAWPAPTAVVAYSSTTLIRSRMLDSLRCLRLAAMDPRLVTSSHVKRERRWQYTGCWSRPRSSPHHDTIREFLDRGSAPFLLTMGSMSGFDAPRLTEAFVTAARRCGRRAVIQRGWARLTWRRSPDVLVVDEVDYDFVFARCEAIFLHGGSGTVASALRSGRPLALLPLVADQLAWTTRLRELGVSVGTLDPLTPTREGFERLMRRATTDAACRRKARRLASRIRGRNGVSKACQLLERFAARARADRQVPAPCHSRADALSRPRFR